MRGKLLSKEQMTEGLKGDELLHKEIILEYNNPDKYNALAHNIPSSWGDHPSKYVSIISGAHSKQTLNTAICKYEKTFKNWKISGYHGGFREEEEVELSHSVTFSVESTHYCISMNMFISF